MGNVDQVVIVDTAKAPGHIEVATSKVRFGPAWKETFYLDSVTLETGVSSLAITEAERSVTQSVSSQILEFVRHNSGCTVGEIALAVKGTADPYTRNNLRERVLRSLVESGRITKGKRGPRGDIYYAVAGLDA